MLAHQETLGPTAQRIIATARQLFMQRGYRAVSISDIVGAAEITKPTLYYHFADKEELFVQMVLHLLNEMHTQMQAVLAKSERTSEKLVKLIQLTMKTPDLDSRMVRQEAREHLSPAQQQRVGTAFQHSMFEPIRGIMEYGLIQGELVGHSADELAMLFLCFLEGFHYQSEVRDVANIQLPETPFTAITFSPETIVRIFLHGVGAPTSTVAPNTATSME